MNLPYLRDKILDPHPWLGGSYAFGSVWQFVLASENFLEIDVRESCGVVGERARFFGEYPFRTKMTKNRQKLPENGVWGLFIELQH